ncbi:MAG: TIGR03618 family F420-dependent PPOX class oxidoreductase [Dehalococcoidia bacterium]|nr:TIGR03618 family F420-dependent PPOX class oxidoreductase [Dehalococcoidia bacterium]
MVEIAPETAAFLAETRVAVIATIDEHGAPRTAPIWFLWDEESGSPVLFTSRSTKKWRNLQANPRVSLCVDHREPPYAAVILDGRVEEVTGRSLYDDVRRMAVAYYGEAEGVAFAERYRGDRPDIAHFRIVPDRIVHQRS